MNAPLTLGLSLALDVARHDDGCMCPDCRPCCSGGTCREHADESEIEERAMRPYHRAHAPGVLR